LICMENVIGSYECTAKVVCGWHCLLCRAAFVHSMCHDGRANFEPLFDKLSPRIVTVSEKWH